MEDVIGYITEDPGEVRGKWRIPNFVSLTEEVDKFYTSPAFFFLDSCWCLRMYPNGETICESEGWVGVYLILLNCNSPVTVNYSFTARIADKEEKSGMLERKFHEARDNWGWSELLKRSDVQSGEGAASLSDVLTISYTLKSVDQQPSENTLCHRLWRKSLLWNDILRTQKKNFVLLEFKDGNISVQREILESSSPVFASMFSTDMRESHTGEVNIEDATISVFQVALFFAYSGDPKGLSCKNVCEVYKVAHKYQFQELKELCAKFMKKTLCVDTVCDVILLADLYQEMELKEKAKDYFTKNRTDIFKTEKWKTLKKENPAIGIEVVESAWSIDV